MGKTATFIAEFLKDGHLSVPEKVVKALSLEKGRKVKAIINTGRSDRKGFLRLFGVWRDKADDEINVYKNILRERKDFGRGEIKL